MKKYIYIGLFSLMVVSLHTASASGTLWEYFKGNLPSFSKRAEMYKPIDPSEYRGTAQQNTDLLNWLESQKSPEPVLGAIAPVAGNTYTLAGSGITSSATSISLQSFTIKQTGQKLTTADVASTTGIFYITLEPGNTTRQEIASCTTVTQNSAGTATLTGCVRGLSPIAPFTATTTMQFAHAGGTQVILSDPPQFFLQFAAIANPAVISGLWKFSSTTPPQYDQVPTQHAAGNVISTTSELASVAYVNATGAGTNVNASETVRGEIELATAAEIAAGTSAGGTAARLVAPNSQIASTTPVTGAAGLIPATGELGTISAQFIATSSPNTYRWGGPHTFSGATTTISGGLALGVGIGTTTNSQNATFAIEAEAGNRPALLISDRGTSTPVFRVDNGASTTFAFDRAEFNQCVTRAEQSVATALVNDATTSIAWDTEEFDTCGMHSVSANTSRLTAAYAGYYQVDASVVTTNNRTAGGTSRFRSALIKNGAKVYAQEQDDITGTTGIIGFGTSVSAIIHLGVNDYVELAVFIANGNSDTTFPTGAHLSAALIGK